MTFDPEKFGADIADAVAELLERKLMPLQKRIAELETQTPTIDSADLDAAVAKYIAANPPAAGESGHDGAGFVDALQDATGHLVLTRTDGTTKDVGPIAGRNGTDGKNGADGHDGKDGNDGLGFDDMTLSYDADTRDAVMTFIRGSMRKELRLPAPAFVHRGFYQSGQCFKAMDTTTHNGSLWIALHDTKEAPGYESKDWALAARKGSDGNPAPVRVKHDR